MCRIDFLMESTAPQDETALDASILVADDDNDAANDSAHGNASGIDGQPSTSVEDEV